MISINENRILVLDLLEILRRYSDKKHPLSQQKIIEILENEYSYDKVRRQTIKSNIERMITHYELGDRSIRLAADDNCYDDGIGIENDKELRITNVYYQHKLSDPELLLIIDSILFSKQIAVKERKELIEKLESLSSIHFSSRMGNISAMSQINEKRKKLHTETIYNNISKIDIAISESRKISFKYKEYVINDNKIQIEIKKSEDDYDRSYIINPYHMAVSIGRYYLICNNQKFDTISTYRIDRIVDIEILDEKRKPLHEIGGYDANFSLNDYMKENIYMFGGESQNIILKIQKKFLDEFMDWFKPEDISILETSHESITVRIKSNVMAMRRWALRYALYVRVLSPLDLVEDIKKDINMILENYK